METVHNTVVKKSIFVGAIALASALSMAQSGSSFQAVNFQGLETIKSGNTFTTTLEKGANVTLNGKNYQIRDVFGVFQFVNGKKEEFTSATNIGQPSGWKWDGVKKNTTAIGWTNNSKSNAIDPGDTFKFEAKDIKATGSILTGYHVRVYGNVGGVSDTFFAYGPNQPVPEPATMAVLGLGALGLLRRRRKNA